MFLNIENLISTICHQHFAISDQPDNNLYSVGEINLTFTPADIEPLEVINLESRWLKNVVGSSDCCAFVIKDLSFMTLGEKLVAITDYENN